MKRRSSKLVPRDSSHAFQPYTSELRLSESGWQAFRATPHGFVDMEAWKSDGDAATWLWFIWQGRRYQRVYDIYYGPKWAVRLATQFARDVVEGKVQP